MMAFLFAAVLALFHVCFASFAAARYVMLSYPFLLLAASGTLGRASLSTTRICAALTVVLGVSLGLSDLFYAGYYRRMSALIEPSAEGRGYVVGHWGWQWYATQRGLTTYGTESTPLRDGDVLWSAYHVDKQEVRLPGPMAFDTLRSLWEEVGPLTFVSVAHWPRLYASSLERPVWTFSKQPIDTIFELEVTKRRDAVVRKIMRDIRGTPDWLENVQAKAREHGMPLDSVILFDAIWTVGRLEEEPMEKPPEP